VGKRRGLPRRRRWRIGPKVVGREDGFMGLGKGAPKNLFAIGRLHVDRAQFGMFGEHAVERLRDRGGDPRRGGAIEVGGKEPLADEGEVFELFAYALVDRCALRRCGNGQDLRAARPRVLPPRPFGDGKQGERSNKERPQGNARVSQHESKKARDDAHSTCVLGLGIGLPRKTRARGGGVGILRAGGGASVGAMPSAWGERSEAP